MISYFHNLDLDDECHEHLDRPTPRLSFEHNASWMTAPAESSHPSQLHLSSDYDEIQTVQNDQRRNHSRRQNKQMTKAKPQELLMSTSTDNIRRIKKKGKFFKPRIRHQAEEPSYENILRYIFIISLLLILVVTFGYVTKEHIVVFIFILTLFSCVHIMCQSLTRRNH